MVAEFYRIRLAAATDGTVMHARSAKLQQRKAA
jgi:hypothetical protein